jgi:hypothetical protein
MYAAYVGCRAWAASSWWPLDGSFRLLEQGNWIFVLLDGRMHARHQAEGGGGHTLPAPKHLLTKTMRASALPPFLAVFFLQKPFPSGKTPVSPSPRADGSQPTCPDLTCAKLHSRPIPMETLPTLTIPRRCGRPSSPSRLSSSSLLLLRRRAVYITTDII